MRLLGIDYGSKKVGLALSDEAGRFAYSHSVVATRQALETIVAICQQEGVSAMVMGESLNYAKEPNEIMAEATTFKTKLEQATNLKVVFEPEFLTTMEADRLAGNDDGLRDARAAALILKSYIDRSIL